MLLIIASDLLCPLWSRLEFPAQDRLSSQKPDQTRIRTGSNPDLRCTPNLPLLVALAETFPTHLISPQTEVGLGSYARFRLSTGSPLRSGSGSGSPDFPVGTRVTSPTQRDIIPYN